MEPVVGRWEEDWEEKERWEVSKVSKEDSKEVSKEDSKEDSKEVSKVSERWVAVSEEVSGMEWKVEASERFEVQASLLQLVGVL